MFLRFGFANHRSFRDPAELSFIATRLQDSSHTPLPGSSAFARHGVLPVLALYGANGSGKSAALHALTHLTEHVVNSFSLKPTERIPRSPFKLGGADALTRFDCDFVVAGVRYHYGFAHSDVAFEEEWLYAWPDGSKQVWLHRQGRERESWYFGPGLKGERRRIAAQTRDNCLFLSAAAQLNHEQLGTIYRHFAESCLSDESDAHHPMMFSRSPLFHEERRPQLLQLLRAADVGIIDFCVREQRTAIEDTIGKLREFQLQDEAEKLAQRLREEGEPKMIHLGHRAADGSTVFFEPDEESDGTISLINRLHAILLILQRGGLWIVDELDRSLHPHLCAALLELFTDPTTNPRRAQVVFSSHDRALLERLRRDEVVLVDKHHDNASVITRMSDFKVLKREHIQQVYADGRVGGVPILGDLRRALRAAGSEATLEREPSASTVTP